MFDLAVSSVGGVTVFTTSGRGHTPEELADMAMERIMFVGNSAPSVVAEQARAYREDVREVVLQYLRAMVIEQNKTIAARLAQAGHAGLSALLD